MLAIDKKVYRRISRGVIFGVLSVRLPDGLLVCSFWYFRYTPGLAVSRFRPILLRIISRITPNAVYVNLLELTRSKILTKDA